MTLECLGSWSKVSWSAYCCFSDLNQSAISSFKIWWTGFCPQECWYWCIQQIYHVEFVKLLDIWYLHLQVTRSYKSSVRRSNWRSIPQVLCHHPLPFLERLYWTACGVRPSYIGKLPKLWRCKVQYFRDISRQFQMWYVLWRHWMPSFDANCKHKGLGGIPLLQSTKSSSGLEKYLTLGAIEDKGLDKLVL